MFLCNGFVEDSWLKFVSFPADQALYKMTWLKRGSGKCSSVLIDILNQLSLTKGNRFFFMGFFYHLPSTADRKTFATEEKIIVSTPFRSKNVQKQKGKDKYISFGKTDLSLKISANSKPIHLPWGLLPTVDSSYSLEFHSCGEWVQLTHKQPSCQGTHPSYKLTALEACLLRLYQYLTNFRSLSPLHPGCRKLRVYLFSDQKALVLLTTGPRAERLCSLLIIEWSCPAFSHLNHYNALIQGQQT